MIYKQFIRAALSTLTALLILLSCSAKLAASELSSTKELVFSAIPDQDEFLLEQRFSKVANYLENELGVPVRYLPVKSYQAAVVAFRNNQVQLAWFGGLSGVKARELVPGSAAIAQGEEDPKFYSYIIANKSTGLAPNAGLGDGVEGQTFTFGSKGSTSGRLMPEFFLTERFGVNPQSIFSRVGYSGDHSRTIALVESGAYDLGAVNYKVWDNAVAKNRVDVSKAYVIWKTPTYPDYHWTVRGDIDSQFGTGFSQRVKQAIINIKDEDLLATFPRRSFISANNDDFAEIRHVAKRLGILE